MSVISGHGKELAESQINGVFPINYCMFSECRQNYPKMPNRLPKALKTSPNEAIIELSKSTNNSKKNLYDGYVHASMLL